MQLKNRQLAVLSYFEYLAGVKVRVRVKRERAE